MVRLITEIDNKQLDRAIKIAPRVLKFELADGMDRIGKVFWQNVPSDDPLPHLLLEPKMLNVTSSDGIMARIVDVERALTLRRYPVAGTLTFEILDELCPWNRGRWQLETSTTEASTHRTNTPLGWRRK